MVAIVCLSIVALAAIGVAFVYYKAYRFVSRVAATQRKSLCEQTGELNVKKDLLAISIKGRIRAFEERDKLADDFATLRRSVACWRSHHANYSRDLRKTADSIDRDGTAMKTWSAAQDQPTGTD